MPLRKLKQEGLIFRNYQLDTRSVDEEKRTVELSFSSETDKIEQWRGIVILDHNPKSIRLGRINKAGPLLFMHNMNAHLGVVENASIEKRKGTALVRFGGGPLADEKFNDVKDGILVNVSVGFRIWKMVLEQENEDSPNVYRATDWEPYEISLVTVPADIDVGVGRSAGEIYEVEIEERIMDPKDEVKPAADNTLDAGKLENGQRGGAPSAPTVVVSTSEAELNARSAERQRTSEILALGDAHNAMEMAREFVNSDKSVDQMRQALLEKRVTQDETGSGERAASLDLSDSQLNEYSLMRALNAAATNNWKRAGFELECSMAMADQLGREARGFFMPVSVLARAMNASNAADLIGTDHRDDMFIESLRPNAVVMMAGATVMSGLQGNVDIPRELGTAVASWIGDDDDGPENDPAMGTIAMSPKTLAGGVPMSRRLLKQSSPSVEAVITRSLLKSMALGLDLGILAGTGAANQPKGILNITGVNTQNVASAGAPTWAETVGFKTKVASDNAANGKLAFVTTSGVCGNMETTSKDSGSGIFIKEGDRVAGRAVYESNQLAANTIIYGNFEDVFVGLWDVLDIMPDMATKAKSGGMVLRTFQDADVAIGHAESFCINA